eukprot:3877157-Rhodomonas_salina.2
MAMPVSHRGPGLVSVSNRSSSLCRTLRWQGRGNTGWEGRGESETAHSVQHGNAASTASPSTGTLRKFARSRGTQPKQG